VSIYKNCKIHLYPKFICKMEYIKFDNDELLVQYDNKLFITFLDKHIFTDCCVICAENVVDMILQIYNGSNTNFIYDNYLKQLQITIIYEYQYNHIITPIFDKIDIIFDLICYCNTYIDNSIFFQIMQTIKSKGFMWIDKMLKTELTYTKPGSISYLLFNSKPSEQSVCIRMGRFGEFLAKELIQSNTNLKLLNCGVQKINDKNKDIDLLFQNSCDKQKIIYYRELKGNIELDTEKIPATIKKCNEIKYHLKSKYVDYHINCGILNWSVYNRNNISKSIYNIQTFEKSNIKIDHFEDFLHIIGIEWDEKDFYDYFKIIGNKITK